MNFTKKNMIVGGMIGLAFGLFNSLREGGGLNELMKLSQSNTPRDDYAQYVPDLNIEKPVNSPKIKSINILGQELLITTPTGFVRIESTNEVTKAITKLAADPMNDILATFIPEEQLPAFLSGDLERLDTSKICFAKIYKKMKRVSPKPSLLHQTKEAMMKHGDQIFSKMKGIIGKYYDKRSKTLSEDFDAELATKLSDIAILPIHEEGASHFAFSGFFKLSHSGEPEVSTSTCSMIYTKNTMPQLVVQGNKADLEWTRRVCSDWTKEFLKANR